MAMIHIVVNTKKRLSQGDFGASMDAGALAVPQELQDLLSRRRLFSAEAFVGFLLTFPSLIAGDLGWRPEEEEKAKTSLFTELKGLLPDGLLNSPPPPKRVYGLLPPESPSVKA